MQADSFIVRTGDALACGIKSKDQSQECSEESATVQVEAPPVPAGRVVRKTLSRKSPFLPEVPAQPHQLAGTSPTARENGQSVLLGEGSFGQAGSASVQHLSHSMKPHNI